MKKRIIVVALLAIVSLTALFAAVNDSLINKEDAPIEFFGEYESGFFVIAGHTIKIGTSGTNFNYVSQGGQEILLPFQRFNVGATLFDRHRISFLYQPFEVNTTVKFRDSVIVDGVTFNAGTIMDLKYGFPFYRFTYSYDLLKEENKILAVGVALQIRNASIVFKAYDSSNITVSQNVGPVPALNIYSRWDFSSGVNLSLDVTGSYASSALLNGASFEFEGSLLDASLRMGYQLKNQMEIFSNVRFLGGTSKGTSESENNAWSQSIEPFTSNNLGTVSATVGITIR